MIRFSDDAIRKLKIYHRLLEKWQRSVNLVAPNTLPNAWERHFMDSAQLLPLIQKPRPILADLGSGGGFPGLVLAMLLEGEIHLVESDQKKCIFLSEVSRETGSSVIIHNVRIEALSIPGVDYITSRACASVSQLLAWGHRIVSHETICLFLKGKNYSIELDEAKKDWQFDLRLHPSMTEQASAILELSAIQRGAS